MQCKNHNDREGLTVCSVCNESFCDECIDAETLVCVSCKEKQELSNDILDDIMNTVEIPEQSKINFDPTDILTQIENEINIQQQIEKLDFEINNEVNAQNLELPAETSSDNEQLILTETVVTESNLEDISVTEIVDNDDNSDDNIISESVISAESSDDNIISEVVVSESVISTESSDDNTISEVVVSESVISTESSDDNTISEVVVSESVISTESLDDNTISEVVVSESVISAESSDNITISKPIDLSKDDTSTASTKKDKFFSKKEHTKDKSKNDDSDFIKDTANDIADATKKQANKFSQSANNFKHKIENSIHAKDASQSPEEIDEIVKKIKNTNKDGEYDHLLSKFTNSYGEGAEDIKSDNLGDEQNLALPLRINSILYFIASLIPGAAQLYLGLTKRGTTILIIASVFLFITRNPSLFLITTILSFADAQKLRNVYYRGGKIEDTNSDVMGLIKNGYVILIIIAAVILRV